MAEERSSIQSSASSAPRRHTYTRSRALSPSLSLAYSLCLSLFHTAQDRGRDRRARALFIFYIFSPILFLSLASPTLFQLFILWETVIFQHTAILGALRVFSFFSPAGVQVVPLFIKRVSNLVLGYLPLLFSFCLACARWAEKINKSNIVNGEIYYGNQLLIISIRHYLLCFVPSSWSVARVVRAARVCLEDDLRAVAQPSSSKHRDQVDFQL